MSMLLTARDLAERYHVTVPTIHAWHRRGWIPCLRAGRRPVLFEAQAVEQALRDRGRVSETVEEEVVSHQPIGGAR